MADKIYVAQTNVAGTNLAAKVTGKTTGTVEVPYNATLPTAIVVGANVGMKWRQVARIIKSAFGAITYQGNPFKDGLPNQALWEGFPAGGILFTGEVPKINTEWWNTGNISQTDRLIRADTAVPATKAVEIIIPSGRTINTRAALRGGASNLAIRTYRFLAGEHFNQWAGANPFISNAPFTHKSNTYFIMDKGGVLWISNEGGNNAATFYPDISIYYAVIENVHWEGFHFKGVRGQANSGGSMTVFTGNVHNGSLKDCVWEDTADYCFCIGGDPSSGNYALNFLVQDCYAINNVTQSFFLVNAQHVQFVRCHLRYDDLPTAITHGPWDVEPNTPDERIAHIKMIDCDYVTTLGQADGYVSSFVIPVQGGATRGIKHFEIRNFKSVAPALDGGAAQWIVSVEGVEDFNIYDTDADGGMASGYVTMEKCRRAIIDGANLNNGGSSKIIIRATQGVTVRNIKSTNGYKQVVEENYYHPVLANGSVLEMLYGWYNYFGRIFEHYEGLSFNLLNAENVITATTTPANIDPHGFKTATVTTSVGGSKSAQTFTTVTSNTITLTAHGLVKGEPVTMTSAGTLPTGIPKRAYAVPIDANNVKLANSVANAVAATPVTLTITGNGTGTHSLTPFYLTAKYCAPADVDLTNNKVSFPDHNLNIGSFVGYDNVGGTNITGLRKMGEVVGGILQSGVYAVRPDGDDHLKFYPTRADAVADTNVIDLSGQGTGTHYFMPCARMASTDNTYYVDLDWSVTKAEDSTSVIVGTTGVHPDSLTNFARTATASATSEAANYEASRAVDGYRHANNQWGADTGAGKGWKSSGIPTTTPQALEVDFGETKSIQNVAVWFNGDLAYTTTEPSAADTGTNFVASDYEIQLWNGSAWVTLAAETTNNFLKRSYTFAPTMASKARIYITSMYFSGSEAYVNEFEVNG